MPISISINISYLHRCKLLRKYLIVIYDEENNNWKVVIVNDPLQFIKGLFSVLVL